MKEFPRLKYPMDFKAVEDKDRLLCLAYDIIWRLENRPAYLDPKDEVTLEHDIAATMHNLGSYIEHEMPNGGEKMFDSAELLNGKLF